MLVFNEDGLYRHWDQAPDFRTAFCRWADEILSHVDDQQLNPQAELWIDANAIAEAHQHDGPEQYRQLRAALLPHHKDGTTIVQLAGAADLPVSVTVGALFTPSAERNYSRYVYGERWILEWGSTSSVAKTCRATTLDESTVRILLGRHRVRSARYASDKSALRLEAEVLLAELTPKAALAILRERHPAGDLPSISTLSNWRRRSVA